MIGHLPDLPSILDGDIWGFLSWNPFARWFNQF